MKQLTIVMDDRVGLLADLSYILGKAKINIEAVSVEVYAGKGIINIVVKDEKKATLLLKANGYNLLSTDMIIIKLKDEPGALSAISKKLQVAKINIENLYILVRGDGYCVDALKVDKPAKAKKVLANYLVKA
ncbi:MAG: hypothetical protein NT051_05640 [Candidatus Micrarchaeota archaeon]|nr:hypothetical protein [Candidatus Micrarchaeota archaeon]